MAKENKKEVSFVEGPIFQSLIRFALPARAALPVPAVALLAAGGLLYTAGGLIYMIKRPNLSERFGFHEIFHLFVIAGSLCHYFLVLLYIA